MGWKSSLTIHLGFWLYLVGGGAVYYYIENPMYHLHSTPKPMTINATFCQHLMNSVENYVTTHGIVPLESKDYSKVWIKVMNDSCNDLTNSGKVEENGNLDVAWEFSSALFFCMTILTTIGYGSFSPKSGWGKLFCIFYGLIGIPMCGIFLAKTSNYFSNRFLHLYKLRRRKQKIEKWHDICIAAIFFLLPGLAVFLFFPAAIFTYLENWSYLDATYFSFVTLTTIGFGDIIVAQETNYPMLWFYRTCWIFWVILGIAYWVTIISFITKALRSKRLRQKWAKTSHALSVQAKQVKRVVKQFSSNDFNNFNKSPFTALKTKAAFDFAVQFTSSMGQKHAELERQPIPATAAFVSGGELLASTELPVKKLSHQREQQKQAINESTPVHVLAEDQVETSPQTKVLPRSSLINTHPCSSMDSGISNNKTAISSKSSTPCDSRQLSITNSEISLPSSLPYTTEIAKRSKWKGKLLARSQTQPELQHQTLLIENQAALRNLLMKAIVILEQIDVDATMVSQIKK